MAFRSDPTDRVVLRGRRRRVLLGPAFTTFVPAEAFNRGADEEVRPYRGEKKGIPLCVFFHYWKPLSNGRLLRMHPARHSSARLF